MTNKQIEIDLVSKSIRNLAKLEGEKCIIALKDHQIETKMYIALLISESIQQIHLTDSATTKFNFDLRISSTSFDLFKNYIRTGVLKAKVDKRTFDELSRIGETLGIKKLTRISQIITNIEDLSIKNISSMIERDKLYNHTDKIEYIANNFYSYNLTDLIRCSIDLGYDFVECLLLCQKLVVNSEDQLLKYIISLSKEKPEFIRLFKHIHSEYVSKQCFSEFCDFVDELVSNEFDPIWSCLKKRLNSNFSNIRRYPRNTPIRGIRTSMAENKKYEIMCSSELRESELNKINNEDLPDRDVQTDDIENSWFKFKIKNGYFIPEKYVLVSRCSHTNKDYCLQNWRLEGKNLENEWITIHEVKNNPLELNETYEKDIDIEGKFKCFKITQIDKNTNGSYYFGLQTFDIKGLYFEMS